MLSENTNRCTKRTSLEFEHDSRTLLILFHSVIKLKCESTLLSCSELNKYENTGIHENTNGVILRPSMFNSFQFLLFNKLSICPLYSFHWFISYSPFTYACRWQCYIYYILAIPIAARHTQRDMWLHIFQRLILNQIWQHRWIAIEWTPPWQFYCTWTNFEYLQMRGGIGTLLHGQINNMFGSSIWIFGNAFVNARIMAIRTGNGHLRVNALFGFHFRYTKTEII